MGRCTAPAESAVRWIPLATVPPGPSCREKSPPYWAPVERELRRLLHQEPGAGQGQELQVRLRLALLGVDLPAEPDLEAEVETSPSKKRERRDGDFHGNQDPTQQQSCITHQKETSAVDR